mmetsp:Transcript_110249/g.318655  ORF Transcript_110249/g.318655 Transcript_110249/m.318655 type:complete len:205 (-) Transcript_110249:250-864(-)
MAQCPPPTRTRSSGRRSAASGRHSPPRTRSSASRPSSGCSSSSPASSGARRRPRRRSWPSPSCSCSLRRLRGPRCSCSAPRTSTTSTAPSAATRTLSSRCSPRSCSRTSPPARCARAPPPSPPWPRARCSCCPWLCATGWPSPTPRTATSMRSSPWRSFWTSAPPSRSSSAPWPLRGGRATAAAPSPRSRSLCCRCCSSCPPTS